MEIYSFQQHKQQQKSTYIQDIKSMKSYSDKQLFYSSVSNWKKILFFYYFYPFFSVYVSIDVNLLLKKVYSYY